MQNEPVCSYGQCGAMEKIRNGDFVYVWDANYVTTFPQYTDTS